MVYLGHIDNLRKITYTGGVIYMQNEANYQHARGIPTEGADTKILVQSVRLLTCLACLSMNVVLKNECCFRILCFCNNYSLVKNYTGWETEGTSLLLNLGEGTFLHFHPRLS